MDFPRQKIQEMAQHPCLGPLFAPWPCIDLADVWLDPAAWNLRKPASSAEARLGDLTFVTEIRPGARRRRKLKQEARLQPGLRSYEAQIVEHGAIPTRPASAHDFFNALIWLRYPRSKKTLHQLSYHLQLSGSGSDSPNRRSRLGDSLTCFDEGGVIYQCGQEEDHEAVLNLFTSRDDFAKERYCQAHLSQFHVFGHGLLEGLLLDRWDVHVSCCVLAYRPSAEQAVDQHLAQHLDELRGSHAAWGTIPFRPLWSDS